MNLQRLKTIQIQVNAIIADLEAEGGEGVTEILDNITNESITANESLNSIENDLDSAKSDINDAISRINDGQQALTDLNDSVNELKRALSPVKAAA